MNGDEHPKIVVIGGGTGSFSVLSGLKFYTPHITALVSMADNGGSTGVLRDEYGALPPGDVRKCLVALSNAPEMRDLFDYRFRDGTFGGHSFGNLFLSTVEQMSNNFVQAIELASKVLNITGRVLPATLDDVQLVITNQDGHEIHGEAELDRPDIRLDHPSVHLEPTAHITPEARQAILDADLVVIAPGSFYGSLAAALVIDGMAEALRQTHATKAYICNLVTEKGQTEGFGVADFAAEIERLLEGVALDYVLYNTRKPSPQLLKRYDQEGDHWVGYDDARLAEQHYQAVGGAFLADAHTFIRHDGQAVAAALLQICAQRATVKL